MERDGITYIWPKYLECPYCESLINAKTLYINVQLDSRLVDLPHKTRCAFCGCEFDWKPVVKDVVMEEKRMWEWAWLRKRITTKKEFMFEVFNTRKEGTLK